MPGEGEDTGEHPGGDDPKPEDQNTGGEDPGGSPEDKTLESADKDVLLKVIADVRKEAAKHREKAQQTKEKLDQASTKLKELEDATKSNEEKEAERLSVLEAEAAKVPTLSRYADFAQAELAVEVKRVDGLKAEQKKPYQELLGAFAEDDHLGRLKAIRALKAAEGVRPKSGDEGSPGEPGGGAAEITLDKKLAWSEAGMREAQLAGLIKKD